MRIQIVTVSRYKLDFSPVSVPPETLQCARGRYIVNGVIHRKACIDESMGFSAHGGGPSRNNNIVRFVSPQIKLRLIVISRDANAPSTNKDIQGTGLAIHMRDHSA